MSEILAARVAEPDLADMPDWRVAEILTAPDESLPPVVTIVQTLIGPGSILAALGGDAGAAVLDALEQISVSSPRIRWAMFMVKSGSLDVGNSQVREAIEDFAAGGMLLHEQAAALLALAERRRFVSWAEYHGVEVTARTVGLARGGR